MREQTDFIHAWRAWRRTPAPTENFRLGRNNAPTYVIELELDHLVASTCATVDQFMEGQRREYREQVGDHLETLHVVEADLSGSLADQAAKRELQLFIQSTRQVLHNLLRWLTARERAQDQL